MIKLMRNGLTAGLITGHEEVVTVTDPTDIILAVLAYGLPLSDDGYNIVAGSVRAADMPSVVSLSGAIRNTQDPRARLISQAINDRLTEKSLL